MNPQSNVMTPTIKRDDSHDFKINENALRGLDGRGYF